MGASLCTAMLLPSSKLAPTHGNARPRYHQSNTIKLNHP
jgi:hypothetical protein